MSTKLDLSAILDVMDIGKEDVLKQTSAMAVITGNIVSGGSGSWVVSVDSQNVKATATQSDMFEAGAAVKILRVTSDKQSLYHILCLSSTTIELSYNNQNKVSYTQEGNSERGFTFGINDYKTLLTDIVKTGCFRLKTSVANGADNTEDYGFHIDFKYEKGSDLFRYRTTFNTDKMLGQPFKFSQYVDQVLEEDLPNVGGDWQLTEVRVGHFGNFKVNGDPELSAAKKETQGNITHSLELVDELRTEVLQTVEDRYILKANIYRNGIEFANGEIKYYWFKENAAVKPNAGNELYSVYGGEGWQLLNVVGAAAETINGSEVSVASIDAANNKYEVTTATANAYENKFKCVAVYGEIKCESGIKTIQNLTRNGLDFDLKIKVSGKETDEITAADQPVTITAAVYDPSDTTITKINYADCYNFTWWLRGSPNGAVDTLDGTGSSITIGNAADKIFERGAVWCEVTKKDEITDSIAMLLPPIGKSDEVQIVDKTDVLVEYKTYYHGEDTFKPIAEVDKPNTLSLNDKWDDTFTDIAWTQAKPDNDYIYKAVIQVRGGIVISDWIISLCSVHGDTTVLPQQTVTFNELTQNGQKRGLYYCSDDEQLYINADYINTGTLRVGNAGQEKFFASLNSDEVKIAGFNVDEKSIESGSLNDDQVNCLSNSSDTGYVHLGTDGIQLGDKFAVDSNGNIIAADIKADQVNTTGLQAEYICVREGGTEDGEILFYADGRENRGDNNPKEVGNSRVYAKDLSSISADMGTIKAGLITSLKQTEVDDFLEHHTLKLGTKSFNVKNYETTSKNWFEFSEEEGQVIATLKWGSEDQGSFPSVIKFPEESNNQKISTARIPSYLGNSKYIHSCRTLIFPDTITKIEIGTTMVPDLDNLYIGEQVQSINFMNYSGLMAKNIYFNAKNCSDLAESSTVFCTDIQYFNASDLYIGKQVTRIPGYLYNSVTMAHSCGYIRRIIFEKDSLCKEIGPNAFYGNQLLIELTLPDQEIFIDKWSFYGCSHLIFLNFLSSSKVIFSYTSPFSKDTIVGINKKKDVAFYQKSNGKETLVNDLLSIFTNLKYIGQQQEDELINDLYLDNDFLFFNSSVFSRPILALYLKSYNKTDQKEDYILETPKENFLYDIGPNFLSSPWCDMAYSFDEDEKLIPTHLTIIFSYCVTSLLRQSLNDSYSKNVFFLRPDTELQPGFLSYSGHIDNLFLPMQGKASDELVLGLGGRLTNIYIDDTFQEINLSSNSDINIYFSGDEEQWKKILSGNIKDTIIINYLSAAKIQEKKAPFINSFFIDSSGLSGYYIYTDNFYLDKIGTFMSKKIQIGNNFIDNNNIQYQNGIFSKMQSDLICANNYEFKGSDTSAATCQIFMQPQTSQINTTTEITEKYENTTTIINKEGIINIFGIWEPGKVTAQVIRKSGDTEDKLIDLFKNSKLTSATITITLTYRAWDRINATWDESVDFSFNDTVSVTFPEKKQGIASQTKNVTFDHAKSYFFNNTLYNCKFVSYDFKATTTTYSVPSIASIDYYALLSNESLGLGSKKLPLKNLIVQNINNVEQISTASLSVSDTTTQASVAIESSDANKKNSISQFTTQHDQFFDSLNPVTFKFNDGKSGRTHMGLIAQDVKAAIEDVGLTTQDVAAYCEWDEGNDTTCGIRYGELIPLNIYEIQQLKRRVAEQEELITQMAATLNLLKEKFKEE